MAVLLLLTILLAGCGREAPRPAPAPSAEPTPPPASVWTSTLDALASATDDAARWGELIAPDSPRARAELSTLQGNLAQLEVTLDRAGEPTTSGADPDAWTLPVRVHTAVPGESGRTADLVRWNFHREGEGMRLTGVAGAASTPPTTPRRASLWTLSPVTVLRSDRSAVIAAATSPGKDPGPDALATLTALDRAADALESERVPHRGGPDERLGTSAELRMLVAELPGSAADAARVLGVDTMTAGATTGAAGERGDAMRIVVNPTTNLGEQGRQVLLTHEAVHAAGRSTEFAAAPLWLTEGYADLVAYRADPAAAAATREQLALRVADPATRRGVPTAMEFTEGGADLDLVYARAWLAVAALGDRAGAVYAEVGGGVDPATALARAGTDATRLDRAVLAELDEIGG